MNNLGFCPTRFHIAASQRIGTFRHTRSRGSRSYGLVMIIAMMYLVLISTLAVGFYAMTTMSAQMSKNDEAGARAYMAAESGMDFMRSQMVHVNVPPTTPSSSAIDAYYPNLQTLLNGTPNLGNQTILRNGSVIHIPGNADGYIKLDKDGDARFRATIQDSDGDITVKVDGFYGSSNAHRSIVMDFSRKQRTSSIFDFAVASKGQIQMDKGQVDAVDPRESSLATIFSGRASGNAIKLAGGIVGGKLNLLSTATLSVSGTQVDGTSIPGNILASHTNFMDEAPDFPAIDPTVFKQYAVNTFTGVPKKGPPPQNILIKKNTNPKFNANDTVQGIMYIESPNVVTFNGNFNLQGFIVMEKSASTTDALVFKGSFSQSGVPTGPDPAFDEVSKLTGVSILAPGAAVTMSGNTNSTLTGNVIVDTFHNNGSADIEIDRGSLMALSPNSKSIWFEGKTVKFTATGANNAPNRGITYSAYYVADPTTWTEPSE
jgi:Tfp pilus assembly protein PilX